MGAKRQRRLPDRATIYRLVDLDTWETLYIGSTTSPLYTRIAGHATAPSCWAVRTLFKERRVGIEEIRVVPIDRRRQEEAAAIEEALLRGCRLANTHTLRKYLVGQQQFHFPDC